MKATCRFDLARRAAALVALVVWWGAAGSAWSAAYRILDLGTLGGGMSYASGINDSGQVVGCAWTASGDLHAFRTAPNQPIDPATDDLGTFGGGVSLAFGINDSGQVVGQAWNEFGYQVFRTAPNQPINPATDDLGGTLGGGWKIAYGINDSGQVVGEAGGHAFRTGPNQPINPATDDVGSALNVYGINNSGQVVGEVAIVVGEVLHAFRTAPNQPYNPATDDLGTLDVGIFDWSEAHGITDSGQVVGVSGGHAFRTGPNQPINPATDDLGPALYVYGINNSGQVVGSNFSHDQGGWGEPPDPRLFAWVYSGNGPMQYLNELIDPASGWVLHEPRDINDLGQIVGWGLHNGNERAFLLTPIPEPASLVMLGGCLVGLSLLRRRRCCAA